jgi:two-component system OmpR family response regulator
MRFEESLNLFGTAFLAIRRQTGDMRILVVEDDQLTASALERGLTAEGYAVEVVNDGIDALHRAKEFSYDAMILDLMLPGISGLAVCSELRAAGRDLPVLMLTALGDPADHTAGLDIGADDYIVKPFKFPVLLAHLRALLRRGPARLPAVLRNGALALDPARHVCTMDGRLLVLTPREFAVLLPARPSASRNSSITSGARTTPPITTSFRCTSARCGAKSTAREPIRSSRPSGGSGTGCATTPDAQVPAAVAV